MTTGDLVVAGRNAVEANAGQWALVQELQTAPLQLLIARSADLTIRARGPGHHERPAKSSTSGAEHSAVFPLP